MTERGTKANQAADVNPETTFTVPIPDVDPAKLGRSIGEHLKTRSADEVRAFYQAMCMTIQSRAKSLEEIAAKTPRGYALFVEPNGVGGRVYWSDEIGGGVYVWDTSLVADETIYAALAAESNARQIEWIERTKVGETK